MSSRRSESITGARFRRRRVRRLLAVSGAVAALVASAACGSSGGAASGGSGAPAPTGPPIVIGMINSNAGAAPEPGSYYGAKAAVDYINKDLGGINGRPIDFKFCSNNGSIASSVTCAKQLLGEGVVAVVGGTDQGNAGSLPEWEKAKVPIIGGFTIGNQEKTSPYSFRFGEVTASFGALADFFIDQKKANKIGFLYIDVPAGAPITQAFGDYVRSRGKQFFELPTSPTSTDFTAQLLQAKADGLDAITVAELPTGVAQTMQGINQLGIKIPFGFVAAAVNPATIKAGGAGANGQYFANDVTPWTVTTDPDVKIWTAAMNKYAKGEQLGGDQAIGFQSMMNTANLIKTIKGEVTSDSIVAALRATKDMPSFLGHPYTCDGTQLAGEQSICSPYARIWSYNNGAFSAASGYLRLPDMRIAN